MALSLAWLPFSCHSDSFGALLIQAPGKTTLRASIRSSVSPVIQRDESEGTFNERAECTDGVKTEDTVG